MRDLLEQPGPGLAAGALCFLRVRTEEDCIDAPADLRERAVHLVVDRVQRRDLEETASDAGLVGREYDEVACVIEARDRFQAPRQRPPLVRALDEARAVVVDDAVAVEDRELHTASLEMSAMRFIVCCRSASSATRLPRRRSSSVITMTPSKNASTGPFRAASACSIPV